MLDNLVSVLRNKEINYPECPPFNPPKPFPEYSIQSDFDKSNIVYSMIRKSLYLLGLDKENFGEKHWNPLKTIINLGDTVVIKPNFVTDLNRDIKGINGQLALVTHGSVLRPIIDYAYKACGEDGKIIIADTPLEESRENSFSNILNFTGTEKTIKFLKSQGVPVETIDLRNRIEVKKFGLRRQKKMIGDPLGYSIIDLGTDSEYCKINEDYKKFETGAWINVSKYHNKEHNLYSIANTILSADVIINVPKMKTHKKSGVTLSLKNVMGISNRKDWIPHWRRRCDEYYTNDSTINDLLKTIYSIPFCSPFISRVITKFDIKLKGQGNWYGNDTIWRASTDLNKILFFADKEGNMQSTRQREYITIIDGIIAGEKESPLSPTPKFFGTIVAGFDPVAVDTVCCKVMKINPYKIKKITGSINLDKYNFSRLRNLEDITVVGDSIINIAEEFILPSGWEGKLR